MDEALPRPVRPVRPGGFSIRRRILLAAITLLLASSLVLVWFIGDYAERSADRAFDRLLGASALTIAGAVQAERGTVTVELPITSFAMFSGADRVFYSVSDPHGRFVTGYEDLADALPAADEGEAVFSDIDYRGEVIRVSTVGRLLSTPDGTGWVTVRVAETQSERRTLANEIFNNAIVPVIALTLLAIALVWVVLGRAFAPLAGLEAHLIGREPENLAPVELPVPVEVGHLVAALNGFMERLRTARQRLEALVTEAAHEVRTPLASLRAQAEIARDETDPDALRTRIERIHSGAVHASQLVSQLLMDATISHRLEVREPLAAALPDLLEDVASRLDPDLEDRLFIDLDAALEDGFVMGDPVVLREMLRNLVDNAMSYAPGPVELGARRDGEGVVIEVADRGPGIPDDEKPAVLARFRRGSSSAGKPGSGLGLSIVDRIARSLGGTLALEDRSGGGLIVRVRLPLAGRSSKPAQTVRSLGLFAVLVLPCLLLGAGPSFATTTLYDAQGLEPFRRLTIVGTTDTPLMAPLVAAFQEAYPGIEVEYAEGETLPIYQDYLAGTLEPRPDILMSSAADLQIKLANDGYALRHPSAYLGSLPAWASWRDEVFGFTYEPAVIVYDPSAFAPGEVPRTRIALAELLESEPERFRGRVATYDIAQSGVGYLLAAQDGTISSTNWRLAAAFGRTGIHLSGSSPQMLTMIEQGELAIGYNILGSYAFARQAAGADIGIVVPDDYVLVLTRTMLIPEDAANADLARAFVDFTLSPGGQAVLAGTSALGSIVPGTSGPFSSERIAAFGLGAVQPVALGPSLLVSLDPLRRDRFLQTWTEIVAPGAARP